jgi:hypothetical protein
VCVEIPAGDGFDVLPEWLVVQQTHECHKLHAGGRGHCWVSYLLVPGVARLGREPFKYGNVWHKLFLAIGPLALHAFHPGSVKRLVLRTKY